MFRLGTSVVLAALLAVFLTGPAAAHETDQFTVPVGKEFVDHADYWDNLLYDAIRGGVESVNHDIELAQNIPVKTVRDLELAHLHSPETVAARVRHQLPSAVWAIESFELRTMFCDDPATHPGKIVAYRPSMFGNIYSRCLLLPDPRQINRIWGMRSSTIKVHGTYLGTDKIGHFISMGYMYYKIYHLAIAAGASREDAMRRAALLGQWGPLSERGIEGYIPCGIYSNADLAANYVGMKFYINLTEPVCLHGVQVPSTLVRNGDFWAIRCGVCPQNGYFALFISDHFDEALNPCFIEWDVRIPTRCEIRKRSKDILDWYAGCDPARRNPAYFNCLLEEYRTYYGENYGHKGDSTDLITIGNTCFDEAGREVRPPERTGFFSGW